MIALGRVGKHDCVTDLDLPECVGAGGGGGGLAQRGAQEHMQLGLILITRQELLLLCMEQPHHVPLEHTHTQSEELGMMVGMLMKMVVVVVGV